MQRRMMAGLALVAVALACAQEDPAAAGSIDAAELEARISSGTAPVILDVRTPDEFASGHIPGARNVPHDELAERLSSLDLPLDEEIVVHCERGGRASAVEAILRESGHTNVRDLKGHMQAWRAERHPLE